VASVAGDVQTLRGALAGRPAPPLDLKLPRAARLAKHAASSPEAALDRLEARLQAAEHALQEARPYVEHEARAPGFADDVDDARITLSLVDAALAAAAAPPDGLTAEQAWGTDDNGVVGEGWPGAAAPSGPEEPTEQDLGDAYRRREGVKAEEDE
jgi:hypothetical protein